VAPTTGEALRIPDLVGILGDPRAGPDVRWVARLTGASPTTALRTIRELGRHAGRLRALHAAHRSGGRSSYAQIRAPLELYAIARLLRPRHIVEVGVSSGVSSTAFLLALKDNRSGVLHSIDLPTRQKGAALAPGESIVSVPPRRSSGWAVPRGLRAGWDLRVGPSQALLPPLARELPQIDLFLHDDLHTPAHLAFELRTIRPRLAPCAIVLADNTRWTGEAFPRFARSVGAPVRRRKGSDLVGLRMPDEGRDGPS
jgi:predicted O-methyltransferase YrrM